MKTGSAVQCESTEALRQAWAYRAGQGIGHWVGEGWPGSCRVTTYLTYGTALCVPHSTSPFLSPLATKMSGTVRVVGGGMIQLAHRRQDRAGGQAGRHWIQLDRDRLLGPRGKHKSKTLSLKVTEPFCSVPACVCGKPSSAKARQAVSAVGSRQSMGSGQESRQSNRKALRRSRGDLTATGCGLGPNARTTAQGRA